MSVLALLLACAAQDPLARVHDALFLRTAPDGKTYGAAELDPPLYPDSRWLLEPPREAQLRAALTELRAGDPSAGSVRARLILQRDLWAAYDWVFEKEPQGALAASLARALRMIAASEAELRALRTDPSGVEGLPAGVLDATQGWVRLADAQGRPITPAHESFVHGRSWFEVLFSLPGGREETLAYLARLRALPDPLQGPEQDLRFRADLPQMPAGTQVALVRRALGIDTRGRPIVTQFVESVQVRHFKTLEEQTFAEFRIDRSGAHDLRAFHADELDLSSFGSHGEDPFSDERAWSWRKPGLVRCVGCHGQPGIYSVNSFTRLATGPGTILIVNPRSRPSVFVEAAAERDEKRLLEPVRGSKSWEALQERWSGLPR